MNLKHSFAALCCASALASLALAQEEIRPTRAAALTDAVSPPASTVALDLGEPAPPAAPVAAPSAAAQPTRKASPLAAKAAPTPAGPVAPIERVTFNRRPVRVALPVDRERLISFASPVALHMPDGYETKVRLQVIGSTVYATALAPFGTLRIVAEDIENDGVQIPIDLVADATTRAASDEVEIHTAPVRAPRTTAAPARDNVDMVALTRYAARSLYAPRRLMPVDASIRQVAVATMPVPGLYRGARVQAVPIGAWRSGALYVTAVRFTNLEPSGLELRMDDIRGHWLAATPQHGRVAPAGDEADTTVVYLVCDRPFEACR